MKITFLFCEKQASVCFSTVMLNWIFVCIFAVVIGEENKDMMQYDGNSIFRWTSDFYCLAVVSIRIFSSRNEY